jgi:aminocarboxymuconate-semialdehyde decarboxylase
MVIANIAGEDLTNRKFASVWQAIDDGKLPVLVHPGAPAGAKELHLDEFGLVPPVGFMFDTTLAFARMIYAGFLDKFPNVKLIASHGGGALPYLAARLDKCWEMIPACGEVIRIKPSEYLKRICYDTVVYDPRALDLCISVADGTDNVLYGSDYPHNIGDMAGCLARVNGRPKDEAARIAGKNAERIFRL